jgi:phospholipase/carboxylesterase
MMARGSALPLLLAGAALLVLSGRKVISAVSCEGVGAGGGRLAGLRYIERVSGGADPNSPLPLVVVLHSRGATPEGYSALEDRIKVPARIVTPEGPETIGSGRGWYQARGTQEDQEELADQMQAVGARVYEFMAALRACRPTVGLPVVTGSSQGGSMTYLMASMHPSQVKGAVALSGWLPERFWNPSMARTLALHGTSDTTVPFERTAAWADQMISSGAPLEFYPMDGAHEITSAMASSWTAALEYLLEA